MKLLLRKLKFGFLKDPQIGGKMVQTRYKVRIQTIPFLCVMEEYPEEIDVEFVCSYESYNKIMKIIKKEMPSLGD